MNVDNINTCVTNSFRSIYVKAVVCSLVFLFCWQNVCRTQGYHGKLIALPLAYYSPETRLAFGGGAAYTFQFSEDTTLNKSQVQAGIVYTLNKQLLIYFPYKLYIQDDEYYIYGEVGFYDYFYYYYGIGNEANYSDEETYNTSYPRGILDVQKKIFSDFYAGLTTRYDNIYKISYDKGGLLAGDQVLGKEGGHNLNYGLAMTYDTRDQNIYPRKGWLAKAEYTQAIKNVLSDFSYGRYEFNVAHYVAVSNSTIIASNGFLRGRTGKPPFYDMAQLGGNKYLRGLIEGRYRGNVAMGVQAEIRQELFWRIGVVGFGGIGNVQYTGSQNNVVHWTGGAGLRVLLDKKNKFNLRVDYAFSQDDSYLYVTIGEAF